MKATANLDVQELGKNKVVKRKARKPVQRKRMSKRAS